MDRIAPSLEETKTNKMKITKKQLKEIIEDEYATVLLERELNEGLLDTLKSWFGRSVDIKKDHDKYVQGQVDANRRAGNPLDQTDEQVRQSASAKWQAENEFPWGKETDAIKAYPGVLSNEEFMERWRDSKERVAGVAKLAKKAPKEAYKIDPNKAATGELFDPDYQRDPNLVGAEKFDMINYARAIVRAKCPGKFDWSKPGIPLKPGKSWGLDDECSD